MIIAGMEYMEVKPFSDVYFTGMVRDKLGRKMSKSLGNSPDLLMLIQEYGADAVRFGIMISSPAGNDLLFDEGSLEQGKHFNNKLWNALKLMKMWEEGGKQNAEGKRQEAEGGGKFAILWFENRLNEARNEVDTLMSQFRLSEALKTIYSLIWDDFCSWFLEWIKPEFGHAIDQEVYEKAIYFFEELLQLLHPFMPFITEEIYHLLKDRNDDLTVKQFAPAQQTDQELLLVADKLKEVISAIREARQKNNIKPKDTVTLFVETDNSNSYDPIKAILLKQINAENIFFNQKPEAATVTLVVGKEKIYIESEIEIDKESQKEKLLKDLAYHKGFLITVDKKLSNDKFVQNAKPEVIDLERKKKQDAETKIGIIQQSLLSLE
jgi:valyl-tRNA synthetase